ncbi:MAG: glycosyltransferase family 4 protein [Candidatus Omnitrophica bacterium]|nr:glycosyltransferase family 4 protein [Candidatus Omnitrophota bacterium]
MCKNRKIKVLRIITRLNIGGPAIHTILLADGINKDLFTTHLIAGKPDASEGEMLDLAASRGVDVQFIQELGREIGFNDFYAFFAILRVIWKVKPDIIHTHTAKAGTLGRLAAFIAGVPVKVHTFHGHVFEGYFSPGKAKFFIILERILSRFTDRVITVSESVKGQIIEKLGMSLNNKCSVVKLGLDLSDFLDNHKLKGSLRKELGIDEGTLLVGIVGRLVPIKNHAMFLNAIRQVLDSVPNCLARFVIVGDGELRATLESEVKRLKLENHVIFTGWIRDIAKVYADLDVVTLTSLNEGTPVSIIEAMASARPVIVTSVGGVIDMISNEENGILVKSNDSEAFAEKVIELLKDKNKRQRLGNAGRQFVRSNFNKDRLVRDIEDLYHDCLNEKTGYKQFGGQNKS